MILIQYFLLSTVNMDIKHGCLGSITTFTSVHLLAICYFRFRSSHSFLTNRPLATMSTVLCSPYRQASTLRVDDVCTVMITDVNNEDGTFCVTRWPLAHNSIDAMINSTTGSSIIRK